MGGLLVPVVDTMYELHIQLILTCISSLQDKRGLDTRVKMAYKVISSHGEAIP